MKETHKFFSNSEAETISLGKKFGSSCRGGEVFLLCGNLGSGKTRFSQGLALGLGVKGIVNSPTFNIMKVYPLKGEIINFCHIDAYRLLSVSDLESIGVIDYLTDKQTVTAIEWADKVKKIWPQGAKIIEFKEIDEKRREIIVSSI